MYDISLSGTDLQSGSTVTLRLLNENRSKITAWLLQDGRWVEIETHNRGKYVLLQSPTLKSTICLEYTKTPFPTFWLSLAALAAVACAGFIILRKSKRKAKTGSSLNHSH